MHVFFAIIAAGIVGTWANAVAAEALGAGAGLALALVPGRYAVAIALCTALPLLHRTLKSVPFSLLSVAGLTLAASAIAKLVFGAAAPWPLVLGLNAVFALFAWLTYVGVSRYLPQLRKVL